MTELSIEDIDLQGVKAVVFDLDGTLYDKWWLPLRLMAGNIRHILLLAAERKARRQLQGLYFGDADTFYRALFTLIAESRGLPYLKVKEWYVGSYMPLTISVLRKHYKARRFAEPLLSELRKRGIKTAVFSDYGCVEEKLEAIGLDKTLFDYTESAPELGGLKPNKNMMQRLLGKTGTLPDETLMIGDRDDTDGESARQTGMRYFIVI